MAYTLEQLQQIGAKPVTTAPTSAAPVAAPAEPKQSYSFEELQRMGAKPITVAPPPAKPFKYEVAPVVQTREQRVASAQADATQAKKVSDEANSPLGFAKNFGKAFVGTIAPSETGLGETVGSIINVHSSNLDKLTEARGKLEDSKVSTIKSIKEKETKGIDTTADKRFYNSLVDQGEELKKSIDEISSGSQKSTLKVLGELGGTALDLLSFGTYGKATKAMTTGKLFTPGQQKALASTITNHLQTYEKLSKTPEAAGMPMSSFLQSASKNMIDQLRYNGLDKAADIIAKLEPSSFASLKQYGEAIRGVLGAGSVLPSVLPKGKAGLMSLQTGKDVVKGGALGYGFDVTQGLQGNRGENREGADALVPGLGTAIGVGAPILGRAAQSSSNIVESLKPSNLTTKYLEETASDWNRIGQDYVKSERILEKGAARGKNTPQFLSDRGLDPTQLVENGKFNTDAAVNKLTKEDVKPIEGVLDDSLKAIQYGQPPVPIASVERSALASVDRIPNLTAGEREAVIKDIQGEIDALRRRYGDSIVLTDLNKEKRAYWSSTKFDSTRPYKSDVNYQLGRTLKDTIEQNVKDVNVRDLNDYIGSYYDAGKFLASIDGKIPRATLGQKIERALVKGAATFIGSKIGSVPGGVTGYYLSNSISQAIERMPNPLKEYTLQKLKIQNPKAYEDALQYLNRTEAERLARPKLPPPSPLGSDKNPIIPAAPTTYEAPAQQIGKPKSYNPVDKSYYEKGSGQPIPVNPPNQELLLNGKNVVKKPIAIQRKNNTTTGIPKSLPENGKEVKGSVPLKTALGGAALSAAAVASLTPRKIQYGSTEPKSAIPVTHETPKKVGAVHPELLANALTMLESSGGKDKSSADPGEKKWLTGLTNVAIKELKRLGMIKSIDVNDEKQVIDASVKYFNLMQKRHPELTPAEVYVDHYWTQSTSTEQRQKKIDEFNKLIKQNA